MVIMMRQKDAAGTSLRRELLFLTTTFYKIDYGGEDTTIIGMAMTN
jgi:hypothetical protein